MIAFDRGVAARIRQFALIGLIALLALFASQLPARAQAVDWLVNIDDAGFDPLPAGGVIDYVVDVDNNGFGTAPATTIDIEVFAATRLVGISGGFTGCRVGSVPLAPPVAGPATVTCDLPPLASDARVSAVVGIGTSQAGVVQLTASVPTAGDGLPGNNTLTEETTVTAGSDLGIGLTMPATAAAGSRIPLDVTVTNHGPNTATSFRISFPIPAGIANVTGPGGGPLPAGCSIGAGTITCNVSGSLADGASLARAFEGQVTAGGGSTITGSASVGNATPADPVAANNTDTASLSVTGGTDVALDTARRPAAPCWSARTRPSPSPPPTPATVRAG